MYFQDERLEGLFDDALVLNVSFKGLFYADRFAERSLFYGRLFDPISDSPEPDTTFSEPVCELLRGDLAYLSDPFNAVLLQEFSRLLSDAADLIDRQRF